MRRTVLSAVALACTAVLASTVPAFADGATPSPSPTSAQSPSARPSTAPPAASPAPTKVAQPSQVAAVPKGAPDTGVAPVASHSGADGGLIGGGAAAALALGGGAFFLVRRRRATGA
ncbi:Tat pathway signal sequence domain protein [Streptomyces sp. NBC_00669]|uniref:sortase-dependent protein n=1 Tax=unclassified Streptomyces TaxID=2593676 RepID=UPI002E326D85|nr:sortase-dependent protein [Streptomyces sp. NBC_00669]